ncbi:hypothetical protein AMK59_7337, partial [Oryctes borbonicus]
MSGEQEFSVSDAAKALVNEIIEKNNWEPISEIKYYPGTEDGDGYCSKHVGVEIIRPGGTITLFIKYSLDFVGLPIDRFYSNEIYFYDVVFPAYQKFISEKNIREGFRHVPKCYGTSSKNVIALENIKDKGYNLFDRRAIMDDNHITLVLRTFAKFHAASFAFKDQDREGYDKLVTNWDGDLAREMRVDSPMKKMWIHQIQDGLNTLDPIEDKAILDRCDAESLGNLVIDAQRCQNEYSIFTQGDCWCNNIMFKYENGNKSNPIDIMLVDWQLFRPLSPVFDISYFFYTIASEKALAKLDTYLEMYYAELTDQLKQMGSDPEMLYPKEVFLKEWKQYCKFGFGISFMLIKIMLASKDEAPKMDEIDFENVERVELFTKFDNEAEFLRRMRILAQFMIDR